MTAANAVDLAIVGAGPAGLAAAEVLAGQGLAVLLIDEQPRPGGQIFRQPPAAFRVPRWMPQRAYRPGRELLERMAGRPDLHWRLAANVMGIVPCGAEPGAGFTLLVDSSEGVLPVHAGRVLLAGGCYDMPVVFPGWNLPGVMAAGGIQAFVKSQQLVPGGRFVFSGTHPLQVIVADQIVAAGGEVAAVLFAQSRSQARHLLAAPLAVLRQAGKLGLLGGALVRLRRAGVPVRFGATVVQALGENQLERVRIGRVAADGSVQPAAQAFIACDRLGLCYGFLASSELARACGARCRWSAAHGGWLVCHDAWMASDVPGFFVAGEVTGVAGADAAMVAGRLAGLGVLRASGRLTERRADVLARPLRRRLASLRRFGALLAELAWPGERLLGQLQSDEANMCKCEEISVGAFLRDLDRHPHIRRADAAKLLTRAGMGLCQGRYCQHTLIRLLAQRRGLAEHEVGGFRARFPAKPVAIEALLRMPDAGD